MNLEVTGFETSENPEDPGALRTAMGLLRQKTYQLDVDLSRAREEIERLTRDAATLARVREEHGRMTRVLESQKTQLKDFLESTTDMVQVMSPDGKLMYVNRAWRSALGYSQEEALRLGMAQLLHPASTDRFQEELALAAEGKSAEMLELELFAKDGRIVTAEGSLRVWCQDGRPCKVRGIFRDVSDRTRSERERLRAKKLEALGTLAGGLAHDYNNILTALLGNISVAMHGLEQGDGLYEALRAMEQATVRAKRLTAQLLTFAKGGAPIKRSLFLQERLADLADLALPGSRARCAFHWQEGLWPVEADEDQIRQVITNLMINAEQAMPHGGTIRVAAENAELAAAQAIPLPHGKYVRISVSDEGAGIPDTDISKVFDPYFGTMKQGAGLGLATAYSIVQKHEGYIGVESRPGVGTTFFFFVPASSPDRAREDGAWAAAALPRSARVLIMDDEDLVRDVTGRMMGILGFEVEHARDGLEAIEKYERARESSRPYDAVIMDLTVPGGMGGEEAIERLRALDPKVRAVVTSGYSNDPVLSNYQAYGFRACVAKPYRLQELKQALHRVLAEE